MRHHVYRPAVGHDFVRGLTLALPLNVALWAMLVGVALKLR
jgi:hypothetical protein